MADLTAQLQAMMQQMMKPQPINTDFGPSPTPQGSRASATDWRKLFGMSDGEAAAPQQSVLARPSSIDANGNVLDKPAMVGPAVTPMTPMPSGGGFMQNLPDALGAKNGVQAASAMTKMMGK